MSLGALGTIQELLEMIRYPNEYSDYKNSSNGGKTASFARKTTNSALDRRGALHDLLDLSPLDLFFL